jgi:hypothetical protein
LPRGALELRAGPHVVALLERCRQRRAVRWVVAATGVGAGLSLVFGAVWLQAEVAAGQLLDQKRGLTQNESTAYQDDVARRDQFRVATILTLSLTGALALVAGGLFYFDHPTADAAR